MKTYIEIVNWADKQHYKDRAPPWIKLYNDLLDNFEFSCLQDASKAHLIGMWMLASRTKNKMPYDSRWIGNKINATEDVDLKVLEEAGFIKVVGEKPLINQELPIVEQDASKPLAMCLPREEREQSRAEESREEKTSVKQSSTSPAVQEIFEHWQKVMNHPNANLDDKRKKLIAKPLKDGYTVEDLKAAITGCSYTGHNMGENDRGQRYDGLNVIFRDGDNIDRFIGNYQNPPRVLNKQEQLEHSNQAIGNDWLRGEDNAARQ